VLISEFAVKTAQPLGFSAAVSSLLMVSLNKHYQALLRDAADLSGPLFLETDTDTDDVITNTELHVKLLPNYIQLLQDIPISLTDSAPSPMAGEDADGLATADDSLIVDQHAEETMV
jgi:hypothetical protein